MTDTKKFKGFQPHTKIKLNLLEAYLKSWIPISARYNKSNNKTICIIDGFCGKGQTEKEEKGSPVIILEEVIKAINTYENENRFKNFLPQKVVLLFNDTKKSHIDNLEKIVSEIEIDSRIKIHFSQNTFEEFWMTQKDFIKKLNCPNLFFVDPFGGSCPFYLLQEIMELEKSDLLLNLSISAFNRARGMEERNTEIFGNTDWKNYIEDITSIDDIMSEKVKVYRDFEIGKKYLEKKTAIKGFKLFEGFTKNIRELTYAKYTAGMEMTNEKNQVIYFMVFMTKHPLGILKFVKKLWEIDKEYGMFATSYSNDLENQLSLFEEVEKESREEKLVENLANGIVEKFSGKTTILSSKNYDEIELRVYCATRFWMTDSHLKKALKKLEEGKKIVKEPLDGKVLRKNTFPFDSTDNGERRFSIKFL